MTEEKEQQGRTVTIKGELFKRLSWPVVRVLCTILGLVLIKAFLVAISRYILGIRRKATVSVDEKKITVESVYSIFGKQFKKSTLVSPISGIEAVKREKRMLNIHLTVGFGFLMVGLFAGVHWLLDGLRAGYPYLFLLGSGLILAGVVTDIVLYLFVPVSFGRTSLILSMGPWNHRLAGVDDSAADEFMEHFKNVAGLASVRKPD